MRLISYKKNGESRIGLRREGDILDLSIIAPGLPTSIVGLLEIGSEAMVAAVTAGEAAGVDAIVSPEEITYAPVTPRPPKIICIGRNYAAHAREGGVEPPSYPEIFYRGATSLVGHNQPILRPLCSDKLDYEAELVAIVGK
ncbi:MAG: fumarylacetoacetate hydrolase family protein, partial [Sneathiella sp.]|nr:fumarylacetoacetate hydrolase family protein [Sneathiella sp.]